MKRTKKNQIFAGIALFAIFFSAISTAILVMVSPVSAPAPENNTKQETDISKILKNTIWDTKIATGSTLTWTTK